MPRIPNECARVSLPSPGACLQGPPVVRGLFGSLRGYKGDISPAAALDAVANQREPAPHFPSSCFVSSCMLNLHLPGHQLASCSHYLPTPEVSQHHALPGVFHCQAATNQREPAVSLLV